MINYLVNTTVKIFETPSSASLQLGTLLKGMTGTAYSNSGTWLRLATKNGAPQNGYANSRTGEGMTNGDITWRSNTVTPPPPPPPPVTTGTAFTLTIAGYKPYTGTLEKL